MNEPNSNYDTYGKIIAIDATQKFPSGFTKREFVLEVAGKYPQQVKFQMFKERADVLESFKVGQMASVNSNVEGREHNGNYYVNLTAWKIVADTPEGNQEEQPPRQQQPAQSQGAPLDGGEPDDIPF